MRWRPVSTPPLRGMPKDSPQLHWSQPMSSTAKPSGQIRLQASNAGHCAGQAGRAGLSSLSSGHWATVSHSCAAAMQCPESVTGLLRTLGLADTLLHQSDQNTAVHHRIAHASARSWCHYSATLLVDRGRSYLTGSIRIRSSSEIGFRLRGIQSRCPLRAAGRYLHPHCGNGFHLRPGWGTNRARRPPYIGIHHTTSDNPRWALDSRTSRGSVHRARMPRNWEPPQSMSFHLVT